MSIREELNISDEIWAAFERWAPGISHDPSKDDWVRLRMSILQFLQACYRDLPLSSPVLEVGSWSLIPGADYSFFAEKYRLFRSNYSYGNGKAPLDLLVDAMDMAEIDNESLGCIIATDVLEHLTDPFRALAEFYRTLKNGGYALITVPFFFRIHDPDYFRFCPKGLEQALRNAGFDEIKVICDGDTPINIQVIARKQKRHSLLLLGGGAACTHVEILKRRFRVLTTDTDPAAATSHVADRVFLTAPFVSADFDRQVLALCLEQQVTAVLPSIHESVPALLRCRRALEDAGVRVLLPDDAVTRACLDKRATATLFQEAGLRPVPEVPADSPPFPSVLKALDGAGGRGVFMLDNALDLAAAREKVNRHKANNYIVQEFIDGDEYTIDALCDWDGRVLVAVPRVRIQTKGGETTRGRTVRHPGILAAVEALAKRHRFCGLVTIQCFERNGEVLFSEINPRFGGGMTFSAAAGAPFADLLHSLLDGQRPAPVTEWREGASFVRAFRDFRGRDPDLVRRRL